MSFALIEWLSGGLGGHSFFIFLKGFLLLLFGELLPFPELHERHLLSLWPLSLDCDYIISLFTVYVY